jgi:hypothetical protein
VMEKWTQFRTGVEKGGVETLAERP